VKESKALSAPTTAELLTQSEAARALSRIEAARSSFELRLHQLEARIETSVRPSALIAQAPRLSIGFALAGGFIAGLLFEAVVSSASPSQPRLKGNEDER
jgi:hypothetical protein